MGCKNLTLSWTSLTLQSRQLNPLRPLSLYGFPNNFRKDSEVTVFLRKLCGFKPSVGRPNLVWKSAFFNCRGGFFNLAISSSTSSTQVKDLTLGPFPFFFATDFAKPSPS